MTNKDTRQFVCSNADDRMDACQIITSEENEHGEKYQNAVSDDEDSEEIQLKSRANSVNDDSGFNSSTSEDRDDIDIRLRQKCNFSGVQDLVGENTTIKTCSSHNLLHKNDKLSVCSELATSGICVQNCEHLPLEVNSTNEVNSQENSDSVIVDNVEQNSGVNSVSNNVSVRNHSRIRRQRTDNSLVLLDTPVPSRTPRNRRHRSRDINNNDAAHRNINSYLRKPLFKLQDCFQNQGLLGLAACITYTLILMFVFCIFGGILNSLKSTIGTQNLRDIRQNIVQARHTRKPMTSG